jgi:hypothetical protein
MSEDAKVIWKKGDSTMPDKAQYVVDAARGELLLKTLGISDEVANAIRYNAEKNEQSINDYISRIVLKAVS